MRKYLRAGQQGFSLSELIVVISIIAILSAIALPMLMVWYRNASLQVAGRDLYSTLKLTQANAARRDQNCAITFIGGGYAAYVDLNGDFKQDAGEPLLAEHRWSSYNSVSVAAADISFPDNSANLPTLAFRPNTLPVSASGLPNGSVTLKSTTGRVLTVSSNISGNITIKRK